LFQRLRPECFQIVDTKGIFVLDGRENLTIRPSLTAIVCNRNHSLCLPRALGAILSQSPPFDQIIVVDDASTDESVAVIEDLRSKHPNFLFIRQPQRLGPTASASAVLHKATGDYVGWFAADDQIMPGFTSRALALLEQHPTLGVIAGEVNFTRLGGDNRIVREYRYHLAADCALDAEDVFRWMQLQYLWLPAYAALVKRSLLLELGGWPHDLDWFSDWYPVQMAAYVDGAGLIAAPMAIIYESEDSDGQRGRHDPKRRDAALDALLDRLARPENHLLRRKVRGAPRLLFVPFGYPILLRLLRRPSDWDLLVTILLNFSCSFAKRRLSRLMTT